MAKEFELKERPRMAASKNIIAAFASKISPDPTF